MKSSRFFRIILSASCNGAASKINFRYSVSSIALTLAILSSADPAYANGGKGGGSGAGGHCETGVDGGTSSTTIGHIGSPNTFGCGAGSGGGGAGATGAGGRGGTVAATDSAPSLLGGTGATVGGNNGQNGHENTGVELSAGSGGGGGSSGYFGGALTNSSTLTGGNGGAGGNAFSTGDFGGGGGGGGEGAYGAVISAGSSSNSSIISGGVGGAGGAGSNGAIASGSGGGGGDGGAGIRFTGSATITNTGTIIGGNGGAGGAAGTTGTPGAAGPDGRGGAGVVGSDITVINNSGGVISGGLAGDGTTRADAIIFTGGSNTLTLGGGTFTGDIGMGSGAALALSSGDSLSNDIDGVGGQFGTFNINEDYITGGAIGSTNGIAAINVTGGSLTLNNSVKATTVTDTVTNGFLIVTPNQSITGDVVLGSDTALMLRDNASVIGTIKSDTSGNGRMLVGFLSFGTPETITTQGDIGGDGKAIGSVTVLQTNTFDLSAHNNSLTTTGGTYLYHDAVLKLGTGIVTGDVLGYRPFSMTSNDTGIVSFMGDYTLAGNIGTNNGNSLNTVNIATGKSVDTASYEINATYINLAASAMLTTAQTISAGGDVTTGLNRTATAISLADSASLILNSGAHIIGDINGNTDGHGNITFNGTQTMDGNIGNLHPLSQVGVGPGAHITVNGDLTQSSSSTFAAEVTSSAVPHLTVTGTATLAGTADITYDTGTYHVGSYNLLTAGNVSGQFAALTANEPFGYQSSLSYSDTTVDLNLSVATPANATATSAISSMEIGDSNRFNSMIFERIGTARANGSTQTAAFDHEKPILLAFNGSNDQLGGMLAPMPSGIGQNNTWVQAIGSWGHVGRDSSASGFSSNSSGLIGGIDHPLGDHGIVGLAAGYTHSTLDVHDAVSSGGNVDTPRISVYSGYALNNVNLDSTLGYAYHRVQTSRYVSAATSTAAASHDEHEFNAAFQASHPIDKGRFRLTPNVGVDYSYLNQQSFNEEGASLYDMNVHHQDYNSLKPYVGVNGEARYQTVDGMDIIPQAHVKYSHETLDNAYNNNVTVMGTDFLVTGISPSRNIVSLGTGITVTLKDRLDLYANYDADLFASNGGGANQTVSAGLKYHF